MTEPDPAALGPPARVARAERESRRDPASLVGTDPMSDSFVSRTLKRWHDEPWTFVREAFQAEPYAWQDHALHLVAKPETRRLALKACKGPGKTALLAWIILWFLCTREESKIGCTSITEANIDTNLWPELYKWLSRSSFLKEAFAWTKSSVIRRGNPNWFAVKRAWPKSGDSQQQADALAGIHADHVMFVLDESGGIPQAVMVTAEAVLAGGGEGKVVIAGNPTHTTGPLYRACTQDRTLWEIVTISGDPDRKDAWVNEPRVGPLPAQFAREQITSYGRDNPWVMVNILGEFPPASINALLGVEDVERAMHRKLAEDAWMWAQKRIGVDVARFGDDRTVVFPRQGVMSWRPTVLRNAMTTTIAANVARGATTWGKHDKEFPLILVDDTGHWGHGVHDNLVTGGFPVVPIMYSDPASNPRYRNVRTQNWLEMAEWVKGGGCLPFMPELVPELTEITYTFLGGRFVLEEKDQVKVKLGRSPDLADALSNTFAIPDMPGDIQKGLRGRQTTLHDFDPYDQQSATEKVQHDFNPLTEDCP